MLVPERGDPTIKIGLFPLRCISALTDYRLFTTGQPRQVHTCVRLTPGGRVSGKDRMSGIGWLKCLHWRSRSNHICERQLLICNWQRWLQAVQVFVAKEQFQVLARGLNRIERTCFPDAVF
jgi:hypothetical protein